MGEICGFSVGGARCGRPEGHEGYHTDTPQPDDLVRGLRRLGAPAARKIVQLVAASTGAGPAALVALADDGTAWLARGAGGGGYAWQQLPALPPAESA